MWDWLKQRWLDLTIRRHTIRHKLVMWAVWKMPRDVIEIATVRAWANATMGEYGCDAPQDVTVDETLRRWRKKLG